MDERDYKALNESRGKEVPTVKIKVSFHFQDEFEKWIKDKGKESNNYATLTGQPYLQNRLNRAFFAGALAMQEACKAQLILPVIKEDISKFIGNIYKDGKPKRNFR